MVLLSVPIGMFLFQTVVKSQQNSLNFRQCLKTERLGMERIKCLKSEFSDFGHLYNEGWKNYLSLTTFDASDNRAF